MKNNVHNANWMVDAVLFTGLCVASILDLTGLALHQWLGLAVGMLAGYHLLSHWTWVRAVTQRWLGRTSAQARRFYIIDAGLLAGFVSILLSGLTISTWLGLSLSNYDAWRNLHVLATVGTLALVVVKIGVHWRWVVKIGQGLMHPHGAMAENKSAVKPAGVQARQMDLGRRDFLKLMGIVSVAALAASYNALNGSSAAQSTSVTENTLEEEASQAVAAQNSDGSTNSGSACYARCPRGCSYPGRCRRYLDTNGNNRCDFGECA